jgi:hypothetical protein
MMQKPEEIHGFYSQIEELKATLRRFMKDNTDKAQEIQRLVSKFFSTRSVFQEVAQVDDEMFHDYIEQENDKLQSLRQRYVVEGGTRPEEVVQRFFDDNWKNFVFFCEIRTKKITDEKSAKIILKNKLVLFMKEIFVTKKEDGD